jgi:hypothetical protein
LALEPLGKRLGGLIESEENGFIFPEWPFAGRFEAPEHDFGVFFELSPG